MIAFVVQIEFLAQPGNEALPGLQGGRERGSGGGGGEGGSDGCGRRRCRGVGSWRRSAISSRRLTLLFRSHYSHVKAHLPRPWCSRWACGRAGVRACGRAGCGRGRRMVDSPRSQSYIYAAGPVQLKSQDSRAPIRALLALSVCFYDYYCFAFFFAFSRFPVFLCLSRFCPVSCFFFCTRGCSERKARLNNGRRDLIASK